MLSLRCICVIGAQGFIQDFELGGGGSLSLTWRVGFSTPPLGGSGSMTPPRKLLKNRIDALRLTLRLSGGT